MEMGFCRTGRPHDQLKQPVLTTDITAALSKEGDMKLRSCCRLLSMLLVLIPTLAAAQQTATPGPEHRRLEYFVGSWNYEIKGTDSGTGTWTVEKAAGGFFFRASETYRPNAGTSVDIGAVMGYDPVRKVYTWYRYWSNGYSDFARGWVSGDTLVFVLDEAKQEGKDAREQITMILAGPTHFTFKWERSVDGGPWTVTGEGTMTKVK
jgi:hypothetical protein